MSTIFKLEPEMANDLIAYLQQQGMNARVYMREGLKGENEWEVLEATTKEEHMVRYRWSTNLLHSLSKEQAFEFIEQSFHHKKRGKA